AAEKRRGDPVAVPARGHLSRSASAPDGRRDRNTGTLTIRKADTAAASLPASVFPRSRSPTVLAILSSLRLGGAGARRCLHRHGSSSDCSGPAGHVAVFT